MACPFFEPQQRLPHTATRLPLGDFWRGVCRSENNAFHPDDSTLNEICNMGYARGRCPRYRDGRSGDAVRFLIARDDGDLIRIDYVTERDHHPHAHGAFEFRRQLDTQAGGLDDTIIRRQALAYLESYLCRKPA